MRKNTDIRAAGCQEAVRDTDNLQQSAAGKTGDIVVKVSIIVPVYNAEKTLRRCVDSILKQSCPELELLLIDDGSTDASAQICREYAAADERVHYIKKENSGVSDTRNRGIAMATGKYLQFVDSDDWLAVEATGMLVQYAEESGCEMVIADFYRVVGERLAHKGDIHETGIQTKEEFAGHMMENPADFYYGVLWNKLYRRDVVEEYGLKMDSTVSWCEDFMFNLEYIRHISRIYVLRVPLYYYVKTKGSLVSQGSSISKTIEMKQKVFEYYKQFYRDVFKEDDYEKSRLQVYRFYFDAASDGIVPPSVLPGIFKLGEERVAVDFDLLQTEGVFADLYRERKLYERIMELVAVRYDLTLEEMYVLLYLSSNGGTGKRSGLEEFSGLKKRKLSAALKNLLTNGFISYRQKSRKGKLVLLEKSHPVIEELETADAEYRKNCFKGFQEEEIRRFDELNRRVQENIKNQFLQ